MVQMILIPIIYLYKPGALMQKKPGTLPLEVVILWWQCWTRVFFRTLTLTPNRILPGYDFISDPEIENDSQPGRDSDPVDPGTAVFAGECGVGEPSQRDSWHGLLVTSMIIAEANNHNFITGIDHQAKVLPVRVLGKCGGLCRI